MQLLDCVPVYVHGGNGERLAQQERFDEQVLHLVTCGGEWLEEIGDYEDNVVLRAVPVP